MLLLPWWQSTMAEMHGSGCGENLEFVWCRFLADATIHKIYQSPILNNILITHIIYLAYFVNVKTLTVIF